MMVFILKAMSPQHFINCYTLSFCLGLLCMTSACASGPLNRQVIFQFQQPIQNKTDIVRTVSQSTGLKVSFVSSISPLMHTVRIECAAPDLCEAALKKLRTDPSFISAEWDQVVHDQKTGP